MKLTKFLTWFLDSLLHGYFLLAENYYSIRSTFRFHLAYRNMDCICRRQA